MPKLIGMKKNCLWILCGIGVIIVLYKLDASKLFQEKRWIFWRQCLVLIQEKAQMTMVPALWWAHDEESEENDLTIEFHAPVVFRERASLREMAPDDEAGRELEASGKCDEGDEVANDLCEEGESTACGQPDAESTETYKEENCAESLSQLPVAWEKKRKISHEILEDYQTLVQQFYLIDPTTMADSSLLDAKHFMEKNVRVEKTGDGPQILIYHTHSQEAFLDSKKDDPSQTVMGVGRELARILSEEHGYQVLWHDGVYDKPTRNGAYSRALPEIKEILRENPSIQVVIDLHMDEMPENVRQVTEIDGRKTAKIMFFNGLSQTQKTGKLEYLRNDYLEDNLAFSFQMEKAAWELYPGLTRKIYLKGYRYNMHLCPKTLLIELGAQNNTVEEAMNACIPLANLLDYVLSGMAGEDMDNL